MWHPRQLSPLLPLLIISACTDQETPTSPRGSSAVASVGTTAAVVVNSVADPGDGTCNASQCTLREAIDDPTTTAITFAAGLTGPITLARASAGGGVLEIAHSLTITGPASGITIRRQPTDGAFRILRIAGGVTATLTNLTIRNGRAEDGSGGGITNYGALHLVGSTVSDHVARFVGGGIDNHGRLTLSHSTISHNSAGAGGGIFNCAGCSITLENSAVLDNIGGGIATRGGRLELSHSLIRGNSAGSGLSLRRGGATLTDVRIVANAGRELGGGIFIFNGTLTLTDCTIARNSAEDFGGGIAIRDGSVVTLLRTTILGNTAPDGGGISNQAFDFGRLPVDLTLTNSTISGNTATGVGGGILNENFEDEAPASLTLINSTVVRNTAGQGGGIGLNQGRLSLVNSLVAQNRAAGGADLFEGPRDASAVARFTLLGDGSGTEVTNTDGNQVGNVSPNTSAIDPAIGPLADNGGLTLTHALKAGSPALDAASNTDCPATDQRGIARPQGTACDIGSYESE